MMVSYVLGPENCCVSQNYDVLTCSAYQIYCMGVAVSFSTWFFPLKTSMSVALTMVAVLTTVPTPRVLSRAAAEVDSS